MENIELLLFFRDRMARDFQNFLAEVLVDVSILPIGMLASTWGNLDIGEQCIN